mmetsp:Transcript_1628/g.7091  ORF Transcript_1628/g.7091 Transcript_1628/m.7091 type:complete len:670 (+) Transcript_1628:333-2342(+)
MLVDAEALRAPHSLKRREALERHLARSRHKLKEERTLRLRQGAQRVPEPSDVLIRAPEALVLRVRLEVVEVDVGHPADEQLQLFRREKRNHLRGHQLVEAVQEGVDLHPDRRRHASVTAQLHVLRLVLVGDGNLRATRHQLHGLDPAEIIPIHRERQLQAEGLYGVLENLLEVVEVVRVDGLHVLHVDRHPEDVLVEAAREVRLQHLSVREGLPDDPPDELEELKMLGVPAGERIRLHGGPVARWDEKAVVRIEHLAGEDAVPLPRQSARIDAFLAKELNVQSPAHLFGVAVSQLAEAVLEDVVPGHRDLHAQGAKAAVRAVPQPSHVVPEEGPLDVEAQGPPTRRDANDRREAALQKRGVLAQQHVEDDSVALHELHAAAHSLVILVPIRWVGHVHRMGSGLPKLGSGKTVDVREGKALAQPAGNLLLEAHLLAFRLGLHGRWAFGRLGSRPAFLRRFGLRQGRLVARWHIGIGAWLRSLDRSCRLRVLALLGSPCRPLLGIARPLVHIGTCVDHEEDLDHGQEAREHPGHAARHSRRSVEDRIGLFVRSAVSRGFGKGTRPPRWSIAESIRASVGSLPFVLLVVVVFFVVVSRQGGRLIVRVVLLVRDTLEDAHDRKAVAEVVPETLQIEALEGAVQNGELLRVLNELHLGTALPPPAARIPVSLTT